MKPDLEAYRLMRAGRFAEALPFAERAVAGQRACVPAHGMLATILLQLGRAREAEEIVQQALGLIPGSADAYDGLAHVSFILGEHHRSNQLYRRVVELAPGEARFWYNLASSERSFGRLAEAESACDQAIALDRVHYPSVLLRSQLRVQTAQANHTAELRALLTRPGVDDRALMFLGYALGKELDDLGSFDEAFGWFSRGAQSRRRHLAYDVTIDERKLERIRAVFASDGARTAPCPVDSSRYVFVVGLPRSGTTLVERILSGLPGVRSNGETDNFARALLAGAPPEGGDLFERAAAADPGAVASGYAALADGPSPAARVLEKLPMNYLYLGAIRRALPAARLIVLARSPLDSCFAMYRTLFGEAYPFSYHFEELARYYAAYERLMQHWRALFGERLHEVVYERLVQEPSREGAMLAAHCGLPWSAQAIEIQNNAAVSLTASAAQVRRPIYGSSSGRWRHYRAHLEPLVSALRRHGVSAPVDA
jgi:tetratricopeptide (TPR) repeat protein